VTSAVTSAVTTAASESTAHDRDRGTAAAGMLTDLMALRPPARRVLLSDLAVNGELAVVLAAARHGLGTPYGVWADDPLGFARQVLALDPWSLQAEVLESAYRHPQTAVPSCYSSGKTTCAAAIVAHHVATNPVGTAKAVTTANSQRQVSGLLWTELRRLVAQAGLPGEVATATWRVPGPGGDVLVAEGFSPSDGNESSYQGIHAPKLAWVVDEAGSFARARMEALRGTLDPDQHVRALFIGNPSTEATATAFEAVCSDLDVRVIRIPVTDTPRFTGERTAVCRLCPTSLPRHRVADMHLPTRAWAEKTRRDFGEGSAYWVAKGLAQFPTSVSDGVVPQGWVQAAVDLARHADPLGVAGASLDPVGRPYTRQPRRGAWVRLGVDVASGGSDRLAISRAEGDPVAGMCVRERLSRRVAADEDSVSVAGLILAEILDAEQLARAVGSSLAVRVKIDVIGVGWGPFGLLTRWGTEGRHSARIIGVDVREAPAPGRREDPDTDMRPALRRDEMWLSARAVLRPGGASVSLDGERAALQLPQPRRTSDSRGLVVVESKDAMRARGMHSPDDAEAVLLAWYEPEPVVTTRRTRSVLRR